MESQVEVRKGIQEELTKLRQALPSVMSAVGALGEEVYKDGALSSKEKRLIAIGIALSNQCTGCILGQTSNAIDKGATRAEILEACSVAMAIGGTMGIAESTKVIKFLDELGVK